MSKAAKAPAFDKEVLFPLNSLDLPPSLTADMIPFLRQAFANESLVLESIEKRGLVCRNLDIDGYLGGIITISVIQRSDGKKSGLGFFHIHGGGMVSGDRFEGIDAFADWVVEHAAVMITVDYRLAPEFPDPTPVEDCFAALIWMLENSSELQVNPDRIVILGCSAGGGLAAGTTLLARDRKGVKLFGQMLLAPMLDDRNNTVSSHQIDGLGVWDRNSNAMGWDALLGSRRGGPNVSSYASPAREQNLTGLPPTFLDCGSVEVFRDETVDFASRIWAQGGTAELHIWSGAYHGYDDFAPRAGVSKATRETRDKWLRRLLAD